MQSTEAASHGALCFVILAKLVSDREFHLQPRLNKGKLGGKHIIWKGTFPEKVPPVALSLPAAYIWVWK